MRLTTKEGEEFEAKLVALGYRRFKQNFRREDYMYWKGFKRDSDGNKGYSIGFAFYDWSKYPQYTDSKTISISLHFLLGNDQGIGRLDIDVTDDDMTLEQMEKFGKKFYKFFITSNLYKDEKKES